MVQDQLVLSVGPQKPLLDFTLVISLIVVERLPDEVALFNDALIH